MAKQNLQNAVYSALTNPNNVVFFFRITALIYIIFAIIAVVNHYSPVPFWDMWQGVDVASGTAQDPTLLLAQHNDHRIVISRIFFFLDLTIFQGKLISLLVLNCLLAFLSFAIFRLYSRDIFRDHSLTNKNLINAVILILLFSLAQKENFFEPFQSQFLLAQSLPLLAFYLLSRAQNSWALFTAACAIGFISVGTMANGIFALPLMVMLAVFLKMGRAKISILAILSAFSIGIFFHGYHIAGSSAPQDFSKLVLYILTYLGNPIFYISHCCEFLSIIAGLFLIANFIFLARKYLKNSSQSCAQLALLTFILFIIIGASITSLGRSFLGLSQALSNRYTTPTLMAWIAIILLYGPEISKKLEKNFARLAIILFLIPIAFFSEQIFELRQDRNRVFENKIAALAVELGIKDEKQISNIFISSDWLLANTENLVEKNQSIFGNPLIKDARELIGTIDSNRSQAQCRIDNLQVTKIIDVDNYLKIQGQILDPNLSPKIIHLADKTNKVIGYALSENNFFKGYLLSSSPAEIILKGFAPNCEQTIKLPFNE